jgi:hypothetical protein
MARIRNFGELRLEAYEDTLKQFDPSSLQFLQKRGAVKPIYRLWLGIALDNHKTFHRGLSDQGVADDAYNCHLIHYEGHWRAQRNDELPSIELDEEEIARQMRNLKRPQVAQYLASSNEGRVLARLSEHLRQSDLNVWDVSMWAMQPSDDSDLQVRASMRRAIHDPSRFVDTLARKMTKWWKEISAVPA